MARNYDLDLFINLSKYKPTEEVTPLENFCTELFVYVLKDLLHKNETAGIEILKLFGIDKPNKIIRIKTQNEYYVDDKKLRPDIEIELTDKTIFIEVKVNSQLRKSILGRGFTDQLEDYQIIKTNSGKTIVFSLTKYLIHSKVKNNVRWFQITSILNKIKVKNQIIDNFISFLGENQMGIKQPLKTETLNLFEASNAYFDYLQSIYENSEFAKNGKYKLGQPYPFADGYGYYIQKKLEDSSLKKIYFIGIVPNLNNEISFQIMQEFLHKKYNQKDKWKKDWKLDKFEYNPIISTIKISDITKLNSSDKQIIKGVNWLNKNYALLPSFIDEKYL